MPRDITTGMAAALEAGIVRPLIFVEAWFANGPIYVWSGAGSITWNSHTWQGVGAFGSVSSVDEGSGVEAKGISISLSGISPTLVADVMDEYRVALPVNVWLGLNDSAGTLIPDPILSFAGRMDQPTLTMDGQTATIEIACESKLIDMNVAVDRRYTAEDQQIDYPGDQGFAFVNSIQDITIFWGKFPGARNNFAVQGY